MLTRESDKKIFLLDAFALIYRSYFAFSRNPRINSKGMNTSAVFGFCNTLAQVLRDEKPTHLAVVFDTEEPTHRHDTFQEYKAHRDEIPEDITTSLPYIDRLLDAMNIASIRFPGYEADDIIGTLAKKAAKDGFDVYMMTSDKDFGQLVDTNIFIYKPSRMDDGAEVLGVKEILEKWGIQQVDQVRDILGLMGDTSDNIPGVDGIGEKTARQLIQQFHSLESVLENTHALKGKLKENIEKGKEQAIQSKQLATIITDVPVSVSWDDLKIRPFHREKLKELFKELEFRQLTHRLLGEEIPQNSKSSSHPVQQSLFDNEEISSYSSSPSEFKTISTVPHSYVWIQTQEQWDAIKKEIKDKKIFSFDTETTSLDPFKARLVAISFSTESHHAGFMHFPDDESVVNWLEKWKEILSDSSLTIVGHNLKYDLHVLANYGVDVYCQVMDSMVEHFLLNPGTRHGMNELSRTWLNYDPISIETLIGPKGKYQENMKNVPAEKIFDYAAEDADITLQLHQIFHNKLKENSMLELFTEAEAPLVKVLFEMERTGFRLDASFLKKMEQELIEELAGMEEEVYKLCGVRFNISSPRQVGEILFDVLKISSDVRKTRKTGQYATGEEVLVKYRNLHPVVDKILLYREYQKLLSTYIKALPGMINPDTGKVHTSFNQVVAVTGRLSSDHPNLQNIPVRTQRGREIRKAFIPDNENNVIVSADYSQIELRIAASMSEDEALCDAFRHNKDIHTATAARVYGISEKDVTKEMRYKAKSVNFGIIYGQGAFGLAENLGISRTEARELIENYFRQYPGIRKYMDEQIAFARKNKYVCTLLGRKRYLPDIDAANQAVRSNAERNAINTPIQGTAADMIKKAMVRIHTRLHEKKMKSRMILQVHDELVFDVVREELDELKQIVMYEMENALPLKVPVVVETGVGKNWLEAHG